MAIRWRILCIVACSIIAISVFLPYFSVSGLGVTVSKSLKDGNDWIYQLIIAACALLFSILGKFLPLFLGVASLVFFFIEKNSIMTNPPVRNDKIHDRCRDNLALCLTERAERMLLQEERPGLSLAGIVPTSVSATAQKGHHST